MEHKWFVLLLLSAPLLSQTITPFSVEKEEALGVQLAADYVRTVPRIPSVRINAYLGELGQRLAALAPSADFHFTFQLVDDDHTELHGAAAFPDGSVFVPAQLIRAAANEDELAGMLAHAIAWVATRQGVRPSAQAQPTNRVFILFSDSCGWNGDMPLGLQREQRRWEIETDSIAAGMMARAGYDAWALLRYIGSVRSFPGREERLAALEENVAKLPIAVHSAHREFEAIQKETELLIPLPAKAPPVW